LTISNQIKHFAYHPKCMQRRPTIRMKLGKHYIEYLEDFHCHLVKEKL